MQYPADIFRWQVVTWSWKQLVETFQVMVLLKNFFRKRVTTFDTLQPEINQRPLKTFFDSPYLGESRSTIFFFPLLSNRISCWKWRRCWGKRFSMTTKRVRSSDWHQRIFLFRLPLAFYLKKRSKLLEKFEKSKKQKSNFWEKIDFDEKK